MEQMFVWAMIQHELNRKRSRLAEDHKRMEEPRVHAGGFLRTIKGWLEGRRK